MNGSSSKSVCVEISLETFDRLSNIYMDSGLIGLFCEWGAIGMDRPIILIMGENHLSDKYFIANRDYFETSKDGVFVRPRSVENISPLPEFEDVFQVHEL